MPSWDSFFLQEQKLIMIKTLKFCVDFLIDPDQILTLSKSRVEENALNWLENNIKHLAKFSSATNLNRITDLDRIALRRKDIEQIVVDVLIACFVGAKKPEELAETKPYTFNDLLDEVAWWCVYGTYICVLQHNLLLASRVIEAMLQHVLYAQQLTLRSNQIVFEFPPRHRPPCRTMPWTILPALVVLWGVCWMFYPTQNPASSATPFDGGWEDSAHIDWNVLLPDYEFDLNSVPFSHDIAGFTDSPLVEMPFHDHPWPALSATSKPFHETLSVIEDQENCQLMQHNEFATMLGSSNLVEVPSIASPVPENGGQVMLKSRIDPILSQPMKSTKTTTVGQQGIPMANGSNTKSVRFTCEICGKTVGREAELKRHHQTKHEEPKFRCPVLGCKHQKPFSREDNLNQHIANMHNSTTQKCSKTVESIEEHQTNYSSSSSKGKRRLSEHDTSSNDHVVEQLRFELQQERLKSQQLEREVELLKAEKETLRVEKDTYANCFQLLANGGQNKTT